MTLEEDDDVQWRLRWAVADLVHYTAWTADYGTVENYYEQYRRSDHPGHDYVIERRTIAQSPQNLQSKSGWDR